MIYQGRLAFNYLDTGTIHQTKFEYFLRNMNMEYNNIQTISIFVMWITLHAMWKKKTKKLKKITYFIYSHLLISK